MGSVPHHSGRQGRNHSPDLGAAPLPPVVGLTVLALSAGAATLAGGLATIRRDIS